MDANRARYVYRWTNERHLNFLKSIETSFVRTMLANGYGRVLTMDWRVPVSTMDMETVIGRKKRKRCFATDDMDSSLGIDRRVKSVRPQSTHFPQDDQVVPEMKHVKNDECDKR
ncbi:hypothetical protein M8C21_030954 [Ambrosia artemisiifolia]|uniref:Uncharacterized protein n=1 Tax=Ambrosia artemisiifolia TaxID=4212 RepID=A0AAD5GDW9_AMBAR|nr:hypothetical protein M8C21_030954 [Ambrosia artemisiifolia]